MGSLAVQRSLRMQLMRAAMFWGHLVWKLQVWFQGYGRMGITKSMPASSKAKRGARTTDHWRSR